MKKLVLGVSLILVGVGVCINVAQAVAAAMAQALQAGVEITTQDIWDAVLRHRDGRRRKTVVLEGDDARRVLRGGVGTRVSLDGKQRHDIFLASDTDTYADGDFGPEGRVASVGSVLESDDGDVLVAVEVERDEPIEALSDAAENEARRKLDGLLAGLASERGDAVAPDDGTARDTMPDITELKGAAENEAQRKLDELLGDGSIGQHADATLSAAASADRSGAADASTHQATVRSPLDNEVNEANDAERMKAEAQSLAQRKLGELLGGEPIDAASVSGAGGKQGNRTRPALNRPIKKTGKTRRSRRFPPP